MCERQEGGIHWCLQDALGDAWQMMLHCLLRQCTQIFNGLLWAQSNTEFSSVVCILMQGYSVRVRGPMHHPSVQCACVRTLSRVWSVAPSMWFSQVSPTCRHRAHRDVLRSGHSAGAAAVGQLRDRGERGGAQAGGRGAAAAARGHGSDR